jgi:hypothetical protein
MFLLRCLPSRLVDNLRDALRAGLGRKQREAQSDPTD